MKATIEFNLDEPDDRMAHLRAVKSTDMALALFEIHYNLFKRSGYHFEALSENERTYEEVIEWYKVAILDILNQHDINIDELIN